MFRGEAVAARIAYLSCMRPIRLLALALVFASVPFAKDSVDDVLQALAKDAAAPNGSRTPRIAVMNVLPASGDDNRYGVWLSEALASELRKQGKFRMYERARLDAVAKEHALALSGTMGAEEAKKVGELVPVDYLLTGTWTRLGEEIEANLRLLDVVTGEVHLAMRRRIPLDEGHKGLVAVVPVSQVAVVKAAPKDTSGCTEWTDSAKVRLADLTDETAVRRLEAALLHIPFVAYSPCSRPHFRAMDLLSKQKVSTERYRAFLLAALDTIAIPSDDDRGPNIVDFVAATGALDAGEWKIVSAAAARCRQGRLGYFLGSVLVPEPKDVALQRKRLKELMSLAEDGKVGRPLPVSREEVFVALMPQLAPRNDSAADPEGWWFWQTYASGLKMPDTKEYSPLPRTMMRLATGLFRRKIPAEQQKVMGDWMCANWTAWEDVRGANSEVERHWVWMDSRPDRQAEFVRESKACAELFLRAALGNPYPNQQMDMRKIALKHGFSMPGFMTPVEELAKAIKSEDYKDYLPAAELLAAYGAAAKPAMPAVARQLRRTKGGGGASYYRLRAYLASVVGNAGADDTSAVSEVVEMLLVNGDSPIDSATSVLGRLGKAAVPVIKARWSGIDDYKKVRLTKAIGKMPRAVQPLDWLRKKRGEPAHESVGRAIDDVLDP